MAMSAPWKITCIHGVQYNPIIRKKKSNLQLTASEYYLVYILLKRIHKEHIKIKKI